MSHESNRDRKRPARPASSAPLITIGRLAAYAGVTIKAVRHYHRLGLLLEPRRDSSGYRRYDADDAITLIKIRTLAEAGVPLSRVKELLAAGPDQFAAAVRNIDRDLLRRAQELARARERLGRLAAGDRLFVPEEVADHLDCLRRAGVSERAVLMEREVWILVRAVSPRQAEELLEERIAAMKDREFRAIYLLYDKAFEWSPDDPRLDELADRTARWIARHPRRGRSGGEIAQDVTLAQLVASSSAPASPAWERLGQIARERRAGQAGSSRAEG